MLDEKVEKKIQFLHSGTSTTIPHHYCYYWLVCAFVHSFDMLLGTALCAGNTAFIKVSASMEIIL